jgi:hypothetical protein
MINVSCVEIAVCIASTFFMDLKFVGRRGAMLTAWGLALVSAALALVFERHEALFKAVNLVSPLGQTALGFRSWFRF